MVSYLADAFNLSWVSAVILIVYFETSHASHPE